MSSSDITALMLQMMEQMREQQLIAQEMMQEQQRTADERQRQFRATILDRRAGQTPTATRSTIKKSPPIKIDFKEFFGEPEDWTTWSKVHRAQLSALGCADALTEVAGDETKVNRDNFDRQRRPGPITQSAASLGFTGHFMQGSRVRYRERGRVSQRGMSQARTTLPGQRTQGAPTSPH